MKKHKVIGSVLLFCPEDQMSFLMQVTKKQSLYSAHSILSQPRHMNCEMNLWTIVMASAGKLPLVQVKNRSIPEKDWVKMIIQVTAEAI